MLYSTQRVGSKYLPLGRLGHAEQPLSSYVLVPVQGLTLVPVWQYLLEQFLHDETSTSMYSYFIPEQVEFMYCPASHVLLASPTW